MVNLYGYPGLGAVTFSYSQEVRLRQQQSEMIQKLSSDIQSLRSETSALTKTIESSSASQEIILKPSANAARKLDVL